MNKPILPATVIACSKKATKGEDDNSEVDLLKIRRKTQSIIIKSTLSLKLTNSSTKTNNVTVDELSSKKPTSTKDMNAELEEFFNEKDENN